MCLGKAVATRCPTGSRNGSRVKHSRVHRSPTFEHHGWGCRDGHLGGWGIKALTKNPDETNAILHVTC